MCEHDSCNPLRDNLTKFTTFVHLRAYVYELVRIWGQEVHGQGHARLTMIKKRRLDVELQIAYCCPCVKKCADYRLLFWDTVKDKYNVDMSALKPHALKCLLDQINVQCVNTEDVIAEPTEICSYSLASVKLSELPDIEVNRGFI